MFAVKQSITSDFISPPGQSQLGYLAELAFKQKNLQKSSQKPVCAHYTL